MEPVVYGHGDCGTIWYVGALHLVCCEGVGGGWRAYRMEVVTDDSQLCVP